MKYIKTDGIVTSFLVTINDVRIHGNKTSQQIEVYVNPDGSPEYARCRGLHVTVIGCGIWDECFGKQQKAGIIRICKNAAKRYFTS